MDEVKPARTSIQRPNITIGPDTAVFRSKASPAPGCGSGMTVNGYANANGAVILAGAIYVRYTDPADIRQLAANLELVAQRVEDERADNA
jgi:hypothetical protein